MRNSVFRFNILAPLKGELAGARRLTEGSPPARRYTYLRPLSKTYSRKKYKISHSAPPKAANKKIVAARRHLKLITHHSSRITFPTNRRRKATPCTQISILTSHISSHKKRKVHPPARSVNLRKGTLSLRSRSAPFCPCGRAAKLLEIMIVFGFEDFFVSEIYLRDGGNRA